MDPIVTPLLVAVFGSVARELIVDACKDHLKDKVKSVFTWLEELGERDKVELAYRDAMEQAYSACLELLLHNIKGYGYADEDLKEYRRSIEKFAKDTVVAEELLRAVQEPGRNDLPSPERLRERWQAVGGLELPSDTLWNAVAIAFRRQATKRTILSPELRDVFNAQTLQQLKELIARQGGVKVQVRRDKYAQRMRTKFSPVDLANLMPAYADEPGRMVVRDVFVAQNVRENPPRVEIPKDVAERLRKGERYEADDEVLEDIDAQQLEKLRTAYASQMPKPMLEVISASGHRLLVLTGDPGSGKSTLMRYLLTSILEPPIDRKTATPLPWTLRFNNAFPLLIELRDFYVLRQRGECDSFLEYVVYMGKTDQWSLDDHAVHHYLDNDRSLVMFDGLDEIFDSGDRERVMHEIAGFAQRYPLARIIVTSRPLGYKETVLRDAGFMHFGIQDLDDNQIESFISGWFALTFPQQQLQAEQRIKRVLDSVRHSTSVRLLAGNPMLLTIMALLAREEELPRERAKFYEKAVEVLCHHWDANRHLDLPEDRYLNADDKKALLRRIAMWMQAGEAGLKGNFIQEEDLEREIQAFLTDEQWQSNAAEARKAARRMIQQLRERNYILCLRGPGLYGFVHRSFLEYLTAAEYVRRFDRQPQQITFDELIDLFGQHFGDDEWREVLRLICGQIDGQFVGRIIEHLARQSGIARRPTARPELTLAIWCLSEVRNVSKFERVGDALLASIVSQFLSQRLIGDRTYFEDLTDAANQLSVLWPGQRNIPYGAPLRSVPNWHHVYWPKFVAAVLKDRGVISEMLLSSQEWAVRWGAIEALLEKWPDETTHTLLIERTVQDKHYRPRSVAIEALAEKWPDEVTRKLLTERAVQDEHEGARTTALQKLIQKWPDETNRRLLTERTLQDEHGRPRSGALAALVETWPDETTRKLLAERAVQDEHEEARITALHALVEKWPDEETRKLLTERAVQDAHEDARTTALEGLAEKWPDEITHKLLIERAVQDEHEGARTTALQALVQKWPDEITRKLLTERAVQDENEGARTTALRTLVEKWPDETTQKLLTERAAQDENEGARTTALEALVEKWPDELTRKLLTERTVKDEHERVRSTALEALVETWPDEMTRKQLTERAVQDEHEGVRTTALQGLVEKWSDEITRTLVIESANVDGFAASTLGGWHSSFGRIVFTRDLDGVGPYLDPTEPLSRKHIERAATMTDVPADTIDERVRSLSAHLGWDVTKGANNVTKLPK